MGVEPRAYRTIAQLLSEKGLVRLIESRPKFINGIYAVPKKDKQRLIIDARKANAFFIPCPRVIFPNPGDLVELKVDASLPVYCGKSDLDTFYYRIRVPDWMQEYF